MTFNDEPLALAPEPHSVQEARRWILARFSDLGRDDLAECAELATSELVTNAILHAQDPIAIRLRGTRGNPRVEVRDGSRQAPLLPGPPGGELDDLLATFGRGLDIVARCSVAWGATIERDGKVVWFEPATEPHEELPPVGRIFEDQDPMPDSIAGPTYRVTLKGVPVSTALGLRRHNTDLARELRLLSFTHSERYPLATSVTDLFSRFYSAFPRQLLSTIDTAAAEGVTAVEMTVDMPRSTVPMFRQMREMLALADEFCRTQRLLSLSRSAHQVAFQEWLFTEFERQSAGKPPRAWRDTGSRSESAS